MKIGARFNTQQNRIAQGTKSGELTQRESKRLENREGRINGQYVKDKLDGGGLTKHEQAKYDRKMDGLSKDIRRNKHDGQSSFEAGPSKSPSGPSIKDRFGNQKDRIAQGVSSGELTSKEARHLKGAEHRLAAATAKQAADGGGLSAKEKARLDQRQDNLSKRIYAQKHDGQEVGGKLEKRSDTLDARAEQGVASGSLTEKEATRLDARKANYDEALVAAQADGKVSRQERKQLNRMADGLSAATYLQKHDAQEVG